VRSDGSLHFEQWNTDMIEGRASDSKWLKLWIMALPWQQIDGKGNIRTRQTWKEL